MSAITDFERGLDRLFTQYSAGVRRLAGKRQVGPRAKLTGPRIRKQIEELVAIARDLELRKDGRREFAHITLEKRQWHTKKGKGWGITAKRRRFRDWYNEVIGGRPCVYVIWARRKCLYVGRTGAGGQRPQAHFEKAWFQAATRVDTHVVKDKRSLQKAECLAIHLFSPNKNKVKSATQKWRSRCPVCEREVAVRKQLKLMFPLRRKK